MANDREFIVQPLITEGRVVKLADIDPNTSYAQIGVWQDNQRQAGAGSNSYPSYVIPLSELGGSGCPSVTLNVIPKGTGTCINDGTWAFNNNDIYPLVSCSNIGTPTNRVKTIFMCSEIDYTNNLYLQSGGNIRWTYATDGRVYGNATTSLVTTNAGFQINFNTANRANYRANDWTASATGAGSTYFKSRSGILGTLAAVAEGDIIGSQAYIAVAADNTSVPIAAISDIRATAGGVFPTYVAVDWNLSLMNKAGVRNDVIRATSEGNIGIGTIAPTAKLEVIGASATSADYSAMFKNVASQALLAVRNDGSVEINGGAGTNAALSVHQKTFTNARIFDIYNQDFSKHLIGVDSSATGTGVVNIAGGVNVNAADGRVELGYYSGVFSTVLGIRADLATQDTVSIFGSTGISGIYLGFVTGQPGIYMQDTTSTTKITLNTNGDSILNGGNVGIGVISPPTAKFHVTGSVKFDALPTSPIGLTTGELWNNAGVVNIV